MAQTNSNQPKKPTPRKRAAHQSAYKNAKSVSSQGRRTSTRSAQSSGRSASSGQTVGTTRRRPTQGRVPTTSRTPASNSSSSAARRNEKKQTLQTFSTKRSAKSTWTSKEGKSQAKGSVASQEYLWTKEQKQSGNIFLRVIGGIFQGIGALFGLLFHALGTLAQKSKPAFVVVLLLIVIGVGALGDMFLNGNRIYAGVKVLDYDLSGKTVEEAQSYLDENFPSIDENSAIVFADSATMKSVQADAASEETDEGVAPTLASSSALNSAVENKLAWRTDAASLNAKLDSEGLAKEAFQVGRDEGGLLGRISAFFSGWEITPRLTYDTEALEKFALSIDKVVGEPRVDFNIEVADGVAYVTEGHDGNMLERSAFATRVSASLLGIQDEAFVAEPEYAPLRITQEMAQETCDKVNASISEGAHFVVGSEGWEVSATDLGSWITTSIDETSDGYTLTPRINHKSADPDILAKAITFTRTKDDTVTFEKSGEDIVVHTSGKGIVPMPAEAADALEVALFGKDASTNPRIEVQTQQTPKTCSFDEALSMGIIEKISSYETTYINDESTKNRRHNIHLAADLLNNSIVPANEGVWSFHDTAGECNEEKGFLGAGVIVEGEHDDAVGGGICQVATTVFNAVYDAGYPVKTRHNHTLRMFNYPDGRDAAVSWPDLDLRWENDTTSDVLLRMTYTEDSVTASLYGVNPHYQVSTVTSDWHEGEPYRTKVVCNEEMAKDAWYTETSGIDGSSIEVYRTVKDADGNILHEDIFESHYDPENCVIVAGPGTKIEVGDEVLVATAGETVFSTAKS